MRHPPRPSILVAFAVTCGLIAPQPETMASARAAPRPPAAITVVTGIHAEQIAIDAARGRVVVVGPIDAAGADAGGTGVAIVDTNHRRLVARIATTDAPISLGLSERRALAYVVTGSVPSTSTLWTIDLRSGAVRRRTPLPFTVETAQPAITLGVDDGTGHLFVVSAGSIVQDTLTMLSTEGAVLRTQPLPTKAGHLYIDPARHRVVVASRTGPEVLGETPDGALVAFDTRSARRVWSASYAYPVVSITPDQVGHRLWTLAQGGRVSAVDIATGRAVIVHPGYQVPADWRQGPLVVDGVRSTAYVTWCAAGACHLDAASARTHLRSTIAPLATAQETLLGFVPDFTPFGVDTRRRQVLGSSLLDGRLSARDEQTGRYASTLTGPLPLEAIAVAQGVSHTDIAASVLTNQYSDTTGTTRTSAVTVLTR